MTAAWVCVCGHRNSPFASACYGGCGKDRPAASIRLLDRLATWWLIRRGRLIYLKPRPLSAEEAAEAIRKFKEPYVR